MVVVDGGLLGGGLVGSVVVGGGTAGDGLIGGALAGEGFAGGGPDAGGTDREVEGVVMGGAVVVGADGRFGVGADPTTRARAAVPLGCTANHVSAMPSPLAAASEWSERKKYRGRPSMVTWRCPSERRMVARPWRRPRWWVPRVETSRGIHMVVQVAVQVLRPRVSRTDT